MDVLIAILTIILVSNCPCLNRDVDRIQAILESTTVKLYPSASLLRKGKLCGDDTFTTYPNNYYGYGRVDVHKAVETCKEYCKGKTGSLGSKGLSQLLTSSSFRSSSLYK